MELARAVEKSLPKLPQHVKDKLLAWVAGVKQYGLEEMRKVPSYHDEPLKGQRQGQRSIRLSKGYRAFYTIVKDRVHFVRVQEVNKHDY